MEIVQFDEIDFRIFYLQSELDWRIKAIKKLSYYIGLSLIESETFSS